MDIRLSSGLQHKRRITAQLISKRIECKGSVLKRGQFGGKRGIRDFTSFLRDSQRVIERGILVGHEPFEVDQDCLSKPEPGKDVALLLRVGPSGTEIVSCCWLHMDVFPNPVSMLGHAKSACCCVETDTVGHKEEAPQRNSVCLSSTTPMSLQTLWDGPALPSGVGISGACIRGVRRSIAKAFSGG